MMYFWVGSFRLLKDCNAFIFMVQQILDCVAVKRKALQSFEISGMTQQMMQSYTAEDVGRQTYLSCTVFLLSEFGYLLLEHRLLFVVWSDMSEMLHFYACSEI
jgi:hypothetical protein